MHFGPLEVNSLKQEEAKLQSLQSFEIEIWIVLGFRDH